MSRSGYSDDCENVWLWRQAVKRTVQGKRGQAFLQELLAALDAMPEKRLVSGELEDADGEHCALGTVGAARGMNLAEIDYEDRTRVATAFQISEALAGEIMFLNDDDFSYDRNVTPEQRYERMRNWVVKMLNGGDPS